MMTEQLLQFIWAQKLFSSHDLQTTSGDLITIMNVGILNRDAGPDFLEAKIQVNDTIWVGNIELHINASDWIKHNHDADPKYGNLILHVVLNNDKELPQINCPTLCLAGHIKKVALMQYEHLMQNQNPISCNNPTQFVSELTWSHWLERLLIERWEAKTALWNDWWLKRDQDWRALCYHILGSNFGFFTNKEGFTQLTNATPLTALSKERNNLMHLEAMLFGQSGLLPQSPPDDYSRELNIHYAFFKQKYNLKPINSTVWNFFRMHPCNFPTIRIAQWAKLIHSSDQLFKQIIDLNDLKKAFELLNVSAGEYWDNHFRFGSVSASLASKNLGDTSVNNILINSVAPLKYFYGLKTGNNNYIEAAINLLQFLPKEENNILKLWRKQGVIAQNAMDSQSLIQLFNHYCNNKQCLNCNIGKTILRKEIGLG